MGTAERREREKRQRREAIIDAAEKVFSTKGFDKATVDDVAEEVELSKGALYLYFKNKNELCVAIVARRLKSISSIFESILYQQGKGTDKLLALANAFWDFHKMSPNYFRALLFYSTHKYDAESRPLHEAIEENKKINNIIADIVRSGIEDGSIRSDIEPVKFAYALWGQLAGLLPIFTFSYNELERTPKFSSHEIYAYLSSIIIDGIKARRGAN